MKWPKFRFGWDLSRAPQPDPPRVTPQPARKRGISEAALGRSRVKPEAVAPVNPFKPAKHPLQATPKMAMDSDENIGQFANWAAASISGLIAEGQTFLGYPILAELAQRTEYRRISETFAKHMTREWIELKTKGEERQEPEDDDGEDDEAAGGDEPNDNPFAAQDLAPPGLEPKPEAEEEGDEDESIVDPEVEAAKKEKADKLKQIEAELERLNVREAFKTIAEQDGFFGRAHLYIDTGSTDLPDELKTSIGTGGDEISKAKFANAGPETLLALRAVEAVWCYPTNYNSIDPLKATWYNPDTWFVMGKQVHSTRLLTFIGRPVSDLLKPAYSFGGLSLSQMCKPYVDNWLETRQGVNDIINSFSQFVLKTNLVEALMDGGDELFKRLDFFNNIRSNRDLLAIDKNDEDFANVAAPLGTLDKLQAQAQEHIASAAGIPIVLLLMITPTGLNASSEGELQAYYDWVKAVQESYFRPHLTTIIELIQIMIWGEIDPDIIFDFRPLWGLSELEESQVRANDAATDGLYVEKGILNPEEVRQVLADDPDSRYHGITVEDVPDPPMPELPPGFGGEEDDDDGGAKPPALEDLAA